ncbi:MAG TPA: hypothetical protein VOA87_10180 [Thermoanaerobaculia bacterium]|nr:hypothetical protein [Thermoanaerobaculia bacterium]
MRTYRTFLRLTLPVLLLALAAGAPAVAASAAGSAAAIKILEPADHASLDAGEAYPLKYEVTMEPGADHFHVWVDAERGPGIHDLKGTYTLPKMTPGEHVITIKEVDKGHVPTGLQRSIRVTVK